MEEVASRQGMKDLAKSTNSESGGSSPAGKEERDQSLRRKISVSIALIGKINPYFEIEILERYYFNIYDGELNTEKYVYRIHRSSF